MAQLLFAAAEGWHAMSPRCMELPCIAHDLPEWQHMPWYPEVPECMPTLHIADIFGP